MELVRPSPQEAFTTHCKTLGNLGTKRRLRNSWLREVEADIAYAGCGWKQPETPHRVRREGIVNDLMTPAVSFSSYRVHVRAHAAAPTVTMARSSADQEPSSSRQQTRWDIVSSALQSHFVECVSSTYTHILAVFLARPTPLRRRLSQSLLVGIQLVLISL